MSTRIQGDNVRVPGYIFLENPLIGANQVLATGPNGEIISASVSIATIQALQQATSENVPNTLVLRDENGGFSSGNIVLPSPDSSGLPQTYRFAFLDDNGVLSSSSARFERFSSFSTIIHGGGSASSPSRLGIVSTEAIVVSAQAEFSLSCSVVALAPLNSIRSDGALMMCNSDGNLAYTADTARIRGAGLDGTGGKLQLKNLDDGLFYDVVLRTVSGVPTLSVEGSGEA